MQPAVYIMTNRKQGTLYIGVTANLIQRVWQHKAGLADGFTKRYNLHTLVYFELGDDMLSAITHEKQLKAGSRARKMALIASVNPEWLDLYPGLL